jgi:hypothetical protein
MILANDLALKLLLLPSNGEVSSLFSKDHIPGIDRKTSRRGFPEDSEANL